MSVTSVIAEGGSDVRRPLARRVLVALRQYGIVLAFLAVSASLSLLAPAFATPTNILNVLDQASQVGLVALGATVTIIGGGFDLSSSAVFAFSASTAALVARATNPIVGMLAGVLAGLILGTANGVIISRLHVHSFVATLASGLVISGLAYVLTSGLLIQIEEPAFGLLGRGRFLGVKTPVYLWFGFALLVWLLLSRTTFGRYVYAIGGNEEAARLSGVRVAVVRTVTFAISGLAAGTAGVVGASRIMTGQANIGSTVAMSAIAAVVIGGTSIMGGEGAVWRTMFGVLLMQLISNGMNILNVPSFYQLIVQGVVILFAVSLDALKRKDA